MLRNFHVQPEDDRNCQSWVSLSTDMTPLKQVARVSWSVRVLNVPAPRWKIGLGLTEITSRQADTMPQASPTVRQYQSRFWSGRVREKILCRPSRQGAEILLNGSGSSMVHRQRIPRLLVSRRKPTLMITGYEIRTSEGQTNTSTRVEYCCFDIACGKIKMIGRGNNGKFFFLERWSPLISMFSQIVCFVLSTPRLNAWK